MLASLRLEAVTPCSAYHTPDRNCRSCVTQTQVVCRLLMLKDCQPAEASAAFVKAISKGELTAGSTLFWALRPLQHKLCACKRSEGQYQRQ